MDDVSRTWRPVAEAIAAAAAAAAEWIEQQIKRRPRDGQRDGWWINDERLLPRLWGGINAVVPDSRGRLPYVPGRSTPPPAELRGIVESMRTRLQMSTGTIHGDGDDRDDAYIVRLPALPDYLRNHVAELRLWLDAHPAEAAAAAPVCEPQPQPQPRGDETIVLGEEVMEQLRDLVAADEEQTEAVQGIMKRLGLSNRDQRRVRDALLLHLFNKRGGPDCVGKGEAGRRLGMPTPSSVSRWNALCINGETFSGYEGHAKKWREARDEANREAERKKGWAKKRTPREFAASVAANPHRAKAGAAMPAVIKAGDLL